MIAATTSGRLIRRPAARVVALYVGATTAALLLGVAIAVRPVTALTVGLAALIVFAIVLRPAVAAPTVLAGTLLLAGMDRGRLVPLLRPNEAVIVVVLAGVLLHGVISLGRGRMPDLHLRPGRVDLVLLVLAICGSVLPLAWMVQRNENIVQDDVLYAAQLWKYFAVYLVVRLTVRPRDVLPCLWIALATSSVVAVLGIAQALDLPGAQDFILRVWSPQDDAGAFEPGRATSTLGSSFSVADVMIFSLAIAAGLLTRDGRHAGLLSGLVVLFMCGALAAGQFSGVIGLVVGALAFGIVTRRLGRALITFAVLAIGAGLALQPVIQARLAAFDTPRGIPQSWVGRLENLQTYFWPPLGEDHAWLTGVRPSARIEAPEVWRDWIYIESGHTWLLWTGGAVFAAAFFLFLWVAGRRVLRVARTRTDAVGVAAVASFTALGVLAVLMTLDPHLTLRGSAEMQFVLLALALAAAARTPAASRPAGPAGP